MKKLIFYITLLLFTGCIIKSPHKMNMYDITTSINYISQTKSKKILKIKYPSSLGVIGGSRIYYKRDGITSYYLYSRWNNSLNAMLYKTILNNLQKSKKVKNVIGYNSTGKADLLLEVTIIDFYHIVKKSSNYLKFSVKINLIDAKNYKIIKSKLFNYKKNIKIANARNFANEAKIVMREFMQELMEEL